MIYHIKTWWVIIPVMVVSLMYASMIFAAPTALIKASLAQQNPVPIQIGITQFGAPDEDAYVLCREQNCQHRTIKHIPVIAVSKPPPLIMPEPVQEKLPELTEPVPLKPTVKTKKHRPQKAHAKSTVRCVSEK